MEVKTSRTDTYQSMLRALGAFLDAQSGCRMAVVEVPDGFLVRLHRVPHIPEPTVLHFTRSAILEQFKQIRARKPSKRALQPGVWSRFPSGHQDFLRALGHELDQVSAQAILVEEVEDGIVLTYREPEPEAGGWRKRLLVLGLPEIEAILNAAFERRKASSHSGTEPFGRAGAGA